MSIDIGDKAAQDKLQGERRYYSLSYDIPKVLTDLADLIRTAIRSAALAVHESGYLVPEENVAKVREIIQAATIAINEKRLAKGGATIEAPKIRLLKIDQDQLPEILDWAQERADQIARELSESFEKRLANVVPLVEEAIQKKRIDVNDKASEIALRKKAILRDLKKRAEDATAAFFWFSTTRDAKSVLKGVIGLIEAERKALKEVAQLGDVPLVQSQIQGT